MEAIGSFLMDQVLKMQWLSDLVAMLVGAFGLDTTSQWGGTIHFSSTTPSRSSFCYA